MAKKKNPHALALVKARMKRVSPQRRAEVAKAAGRGKTLTFESRNQ
jgi:hypothetical protein